MLTQKKLAQFYADVEALGITKKVSVIQKATGFPKSNVSEWLSRKKTPSERFIEAFYQEFYKGSFNGTPISNNSTTGIKEKYTSDDDAYRRLLEDNDRFFKTQYHNILLSLSKIIEIGRRSEELIKLNLEHTGVVEALQKGLDPDVVHAQINSQIAELPGVGETGNDAHT